MTPGSLLKYAELQRKGVCGSGFSNRNKINPANDFYSHVNRDWIRTTTLTPVRRTLCKSMIFVWRKTACMTSSWTWLKPRPPKR